MSHRIERFASTLKHCIAAVLVDEIDNPLLKNIIITDIVPDKDLRKARVYVSSPMNDADEAVAQLTKAKGLIKKFVGKRMYAKYIPDLIFLKDITSTLQWDFETPTRNEEGDSGVNDSNDPNDPQ
ncbi:MAG: 30S ribosome-binding factor RbfA [Candidatus Omnitrophota bacterium]